MSKGFSLLELAAIITCAGISLSAANKHSAINLGAITSQANQVYSQRDTFNADKYLWQVAHSLERVNNS